LNERERGHEERRVDKKGFNSLGPACAQFERWASSKGIDAIASVGRDMGAAPPRQTEVKFAIPGGN
jgi:hypothetical protein